jgi:hypothetical protein
MRLTQSLRISDYRQKTEQMFLDHTAKEISDNVQKWHFMD